MHFLSFRVIKLAIETCNFQNHTKSNGIVIVIKIVIKSCKFRRNCHNYHKISNDITNKR